MKKLVTNDQDNFTIKELDFHKAYDRLPVMVWMSDPAGNCVYFNKRWYDYTGQQPADPHGAGWLKGIHPHDVQGFTEAFGQAKDNDEPFRYEYRMKSKEGIYHWHLNEATPQADHLGNFSGYIGTIINIDHNKQTEHELRQSEAYFKTYSDAMPAMGFIADAVGSVTHFNKRWYDYIGNVAHTEGWGWKEILHPDDLQRTIDTWSYSVKTGTPYEIEYRLRQYDGQFLWHMARALPIRDKKGNIETWLGTFISIDSLKKAQANLKSELEERKALEEQLRYEHELFMAIFNNIPVMLSVYDPTINVLQLNNALSEITGWTPDDYNATGIMELAYPDENYRREVAQYMASLAPGFRDIKMATKSGKVIDTEWANIRIADGRNVGIGLDMSERKAYERELKALAQQLQTVVENITDGVIVYGPDGNIISMNQAARKILSFLNVDKPGSHNLNEFRMYNSQGKKVEIENWPRFRMLRGESFFKEEYRTYYAPTRKEVYLEYSGMPVYEDNELTMGIITFQDITGRKKVHLDLTRSHENLLSKNRQLEQINNLHENLLYIIAHDLRNPIGNMYLIIDILKGQKDEAIRENFMAKLREMVKRQDNIVQGLVELLEVQSADNPNPEPVDLEEVTGAILLDNEAILRECKAEVIVDFTAAPALNYIACFVDSILKNLIHNAIKYRRADVQLQLSLRSHHHEGFVVVSVTDNGIGIDLQRYRKHLFQPFKRYTQQAEGSGMGLYLVKNLLEKNGGRLEVDSQPGQGSTFRCYFREY